jgi:hypothetical protein
MWFRNSCQRADLHKSFLAAQIGAMHSAIDGQFKLKGGGDVGKRQPRHANSAMAPCDLSRKRPIHQRHCHFCSTIVWLSGCTTWYHQNADPPGTPPRSMYNSALQLRSEKTNCAAPVTDVGERPRELCRIVQSMRACGIGDVHPVIMAWGYLQRLSRMTGDWVHFGDRSARMSDLYVSIPHCAMSWRKHMTCS